MLKIPQLLELSIEYHLRILTFCGSAASINLINNIQKNIIKCILVLVTEKY